MADSSLPKLGHFQSIFELQIKIFRAQLTRLDLNYNKIRIIQEKAFAQLTNLEKISLHLKCLIVKLSDPSFLNYFALEGFHDHLIKNYKNLIHSKSLLTF
jgi:Leucine-rich repeat (LRR) protein